MKNFISVLLALSIILTFPGSAYAADFGPDYGLISAPPMLLEEYSTDKAQVSLFCSGETYFTITVIDDERIELAFTETDGAVRSLWFTVGDLQHPASSANFSADAEINNSFVTAVIEYGQNHIEESRPVSVAATGVCELQTEVMAAPSSDLEKLGDELYALYGSKHTDYNWTGKASISYNGNTYYFKENLDYYIVDSGRSYPFALGTTLGSLVLGLGSGATLKVIATVLGVIGATDTVITRGGSLLRYNGNVLYHRYVMINGKGPYDQCYKSIEYTGWAEAGVYNTAKLQETGTSYTPTELVFNSYTMQRDRAYANYF